MERKRGGSRQRALRRVKNDLSYHSTVSSQELSQMDELIYSL
jgi:hypothetical protein